MDVIILVSLDDTTQKWRRTGLSQSEHLMRKSCFIGKFATIVILLIFVVNVTVFVHEVIASAYVKTVTNTGTEIEDSWNFRGIRISTLIAFAEAEAHPKASLNATPGPYSGYASVSATVGGKTDGSSGPIWIRVTQGMDVEPSAGRTIKLTGDKDASTSASASGYLYGI